MHRSPKNAGAVAVVVQELGCSADINPTPPLAEDPEPLLELYLSPEKLRVLGGCEDLREVTVLEMSVDTRENTLGNFGIFLPSLVQLKMKNSLIMSIRDLGTSLSHLRVLCVARCGLVDLDGIPSFCSLKELYAAYNDISDLSQLSMLEHLELLDLEGNNVDDLVQVQYLGLCSHLRALTLEGNPICMHPHPGAQQAGPYCYRLAVRDLIPQLHYLDDIPAEDTEPCYGTASLEDWNVIKESIKERLSDSLGSSEENTAGGVPSSRPSSAPLPLNRSASRPGSGRPSSARAGTAQPGTARPGTAQPASCPRSRPGSADADHAFVDPDASDLTHGIGRVMCGNPVQALKQRRQKLSCPISCSPSLSSSYTPQGQANNLRESRCDPGGAEDAECGDVFAELQAWRQGHSRRLIAIEKEHLPQVMKVSHSMEDDEEEGKGSSIDSMSDEEGDEEGEGQRAGSSPWNSTDSPDSSFQSLTPDFMSEGNAMPAGVSRISTPLDATVCPSPPLMPRAPAGARRGPFETRTRRLRMVRKVPLGGGGGDGEGRAGPLPGEEVLITCPESPSALTPCSIPPHRSSSGLDVLGPASLRTARSYQTQPVLIHFPTMPQVSPVPLTPRRHRSARPSLQGLPTQDGPHCS
ncbi:leucine-rich repeat-containing protein 56 isoform X2 [Brienomyrus brachyistius]|uniref:leucine-rich repeat-containing protein 56 isoform X2 n=1 Tax=Brienomyrus brachyistius TaxID=42636 RepID=UPI0020B29F18|nr:leucine-rich repeat-containing protein 56 isoform X2 [Brienomyrus brachyistius]